MADKAVIPTLALATAGMATLGPQGAVAILNSDFGTGIRMAAPLGMLTSLALCAQGNTRQGWPSLGTDERDRHGAVRQDGNPDTRTS